MQQNRLRLGMSHRFKPEKRPNLSLIAGSPVDLFGDGGEFQFVFQLDEGNHKNIFPRHAEHIKDLKPLPLFPFVGGRQGLQLQLVFKIEVIANGHNMLNGDVSRYDIAFPFYSKMMRNIGFDDLIPFHISKPGLPH
jgi:hypothetical protein